MKSLAVLALLLAACRVTTPASNLSMPERQVRGGVQVEVTGILGTSTRPMGIAGFLENLTDQPMGTCTVTFDGYDYQGRVLARARGSVEELPPGFPVEFKAYFPKPTPEGLRTVTLGSVHVKR